MEMLCTIFIGGILLSIGWKFGEVIFEHICAFTSEAPDGIRRIRRYRKKRKNATSYTNYYYGTRKRS